MYYAKIYIECFGYRSQGRGNESPSVGKLCYNAFCVRPCGIVTNSLFHIVQKNDSTVLNNRINYIQTGIDILYICHSNVMRNINEDRLWSKALHTYLFNIPMNNIIIVIVTKIS